MSSQKDLIVRFAVSVLTARLFLGRPRFQVFGARSAMGRLGQSEAGYTDEPLLWLGLQLQALCFSALTALKSRDRYFLSTEEMPHSVVEQGAMQLALTCG